jgi:hypothetical protein
MVIVGIILLLPGLCALIFGAATLKSASSEPVIGVLVLLGLMVGAFGVFLIAKAINGPRR